MNTTNSFPFESAGQLMTSAVPVVGEMATIAEVEQLLQDKANTFTTINYIYQVDSQHSLIGVLSVKEVFQAAKDELVSAFTFPPVTAYATDDQERITQLALRHSIKAVPIINTKHQFVGVVPSDEILRVLHTEHIEDLYRFAGVSRMESDTPTQWSVRTQLFTRLPWLIIGALGGVLAALVVEQFESVIALELALAAFIPAVVYIADAVGAQTQMLFIQVLSKGEKISLWQYLLREWVVGGFVAVILSALLFVSSWAILQSLSVSTVLAVAIFFTVYFSVCVAIVLPWSFKRLGYDPAVASGPLATVVRDISSLGIYLLVAVLLL